MYKKDVNKVIAYLKEHKDLSPLALDRYAEKLADCSYDEVNVLLDSLDVFHSVEEIIA